MRFLFKEKMATNKQTQLKYFPFDDKVNKKKQKQQTKGMEQKQIIIANRIENCIFIFESHDFIFKS